MNGYTNEDTYMAAVVIENDEGLYLEAHTALHLHDPYEMDAPEVRDDLAPIVEGFAVDEGIDAGNVNWRELAESITRN